MIPGSTFAAALRASGFSFFTGVPCSYLGGVIENLGDDYLPAANEGTALAMAAGAHLAGRRSAVLIQNSGLGNLINPLTSLLVPYRIPVLIAISMRGWPDPDQDETQHSIMGPATPRILRACSVDTDVLDPDPARLPATLEQAGRSLANGRPVALLVPRGSVTGAGGHQAHDPEWTRTGAVRALAAHLGPYAVFSTTGYLSRELFAACDRPLNFYLQGAMGHALATGTAAALARPDRPVLVLDGDGAAIMHLGGMASAGASAPANLVHVIVDNHAYESTGGQRTISAALDWERLGLAAGYRSARRCRSAPDVDQALRAIAGRPGPHLVHIEISLSADRPPPRATHAISAPDIAERMRRSLAGNEDG